MHVLIFYQYSIPVFIQPITSSSSWYFVYLFGRIYLDFLVIPVAGKENQRFADIEVFNTSDPGEIFIAYKLIFW